MTPKTRKSYTLKQKLDVLTAKAESGLSGRQFALEAGVPETTLRRWAVQVTKLKDLKNSGTLNLRKTRRIPKKSVGAFPEVDAAMKEWVDRRNFRGLRVKDRTIRQAAIRVRDDMVANMEEGPGREHLMTFGASKIWCYRFKRRCGYVSRRHTATTTLPVDFRLRNPGTSLSNPSRRPLPSFATAG